MPIAPPAAQRFSSVVGFLLTGKVRRNHPPPANSRSGSKAVGPPVNNDYLFGVIDVLDKIAGETGKTLPQIAVNWLLHRPTISSVILGARNEAQLRDTLGATGWTLSREQIVKLDAASATYPIYPYWHQRETFSERNPIAMVPSQK